MSDSGSIEEVTIDGKIFRVVREPRDVDAELYTHISNYQKDEVLRVGAHLYKWLDNCGRMGCVFCGSNYIVIPTGPDTCHFEPCDAVFHAVKGECAHAPWMSEKRMKKAIDEVLALLVLWEG